MNDLDRVRISIARDLRKIEELAMDLHGQALNDSNARDFPGGRALNMLGPAAVLQDWEALYEAKEEAEGAEWAKQPRLDPATSQTAAEEQPLNVLTFWTRVIREVRDQPTSLAATVSRETDYLRKNLDWMTRSDEFDEPAWMECFEVERDLRSLVRVMEDVLRAGDRIDTDAAPCFQTVMRDNDEGVPTLIRCGGTLARINYSPKPCEHTLFGAHGMAFSPAMVLAHRACNQGGRDDLYRCLACEKIYTEAEYWLAVREHMEREAG